MSTSVMIIDDHELFRNSLSMFLTAHGFRVIEACDGQKGLELFSEEQPDLVITDINLPGKNGVRITHEILATDAPVPVFVITGLPNSEQFLEIAQGAGATRCFAKPLNLPELCRAITEVLS